MDLYQIAVAIIIIALFVVLWEDFEIPGPPTPA